jgi:5-amino-6-(5-phosphoribosylamino)uracil reductase
VSGLAGDVRAWQRRFDAFAAQKSEAARAASLPPYEAELEQPCDRMAAVGNDWTRTVFDGPFYLSQDGPPQCPRCSLVFVQSADGNTGAARPADLGGGSTDAHLIYEGLSRVAADAVLSGAETVRGGGTVFSVWHPELVQLRASLGLPRHPVQMVATERGVDVERMLLFNAPELTAVVLTVPEGLARMQNALRTRPWVTPVVMADARELRRAFEQLGALGVHRISCIGGRRLAGRLLDAGLVDDLYLTTSPRPGGEPDTPLPPAALAGAVVVRKRGTREEAGVVFEHRLVRVPN